MHLWLLNADPHALVYIETCTHAHKNAKNSLDISPYFINSWNSYNSLWVIVSQWYREREADLNILGFSTKIQKISFLRQERQPSGKEHFLLLQGLIFCSWYSYSSSQPPITPVPGDLTPSCGLSTHQACMWYTYIHTGKTLIRIR